MICVWIIFPKGAKISYYYLFKRLKTGNLFVYNISIYYLLEQINYNSSLNTLVLNWLIICCNFRYIALKKINKNLYYSFNFMLNLQNQGIYFFCNFLQKLSNTILIMKYRMTFKKGEKNVWKMLETCSHVMKVKLFHLIKKNVPLDFKEICFRLLTFCSVISTLPHWSK